MVLCKPNSLNNSTKSIFITDVNEIIFTKNTIDVIKKESQKILGKNVIANCECK